MQYINIIVNYIASLALVTDINTQEEAPLSATGLQKTKLNRVRFRLQTW